MQKKILSGLFALALLATAGFGVHKSMNSDADLSDVALANVEALAQGESGGGNKCYNSITTKEGSQILYCGTCKYEPGTNTFWSGTGTCP
ncbi:NVEALA domain-containing protein [Proteiniphilum sp. X52]|uniref:NVEALA domain-containing protein n=1 Tax=Proteiniphilum sp. X52 TaxID=2382159 RepID=UPI000F09FCD6|nr:NVEALA domain-containing protein [Proteiniphilum sp. X52]RNC63289.1 hypothetical protein D7D25_17295 [Proteiniphilum sp. X52]